MAAELRENRMAVAAQPRLLAVAMPPVRWSAPRPLRGGVLAQLRGVVADLLLLTGMDPLEASDALPPPGD